MKVLLDTHLLLWFAYEPDRLPRKARRLLATPAQEFVFSVVSIWEAAIKHSLQKPGFSVDAATLREGLLAGGMQELPIQSSHAIATAQLPMLHGDPFDRLLIAQAIVEDLSFATVDRMLQHYSSNVKYVG